jgi:proteic killer suppression protein
LEGRPWGSGDGDFREAGSGTKSRPICGNPSSCPAFARRISGEVAMIQFSVTGKFLGEFFGSGLHGGDFPLAAILKSGNFASVIKSFADAETRKVFDLEPCRKLPGEIQTRAKIKLDQLHAASELNHLRIPPSNRLEKLSGNLRAHYSIRINQQWRIIFVWKDNHAHQVRITDYH